MQPLDVLLIEDNPAEVWLARENLKRSCAELGVRLRIAVDGEKALRILVQEGFRPGLILLDLSLARIGGQRLLDRVRSYGVDLTHIPVVSFSSANPRIQDVVDSGASAYIVKPAGMLDYLRAIERFSILWTAGVDSVAS